VLTAIGLAVIYAKHLLPDESTKASIQHSGWFLCLFGGRRAVHWVGDDRHSLGVINPGRAAG